MNKSINNSLIKSLNNSLSMSRNDPQQASNREILTRHHPSKPIACVRLWIADVVVDLQSVLAAVPSAISAGRTGRCQGRPSRPRPLRAACRPSSTVTGRHRAVTINTYTVTVERAVQDINAFVGIRMLEIMGTAGLDIWNNRVRYGLDKANVEGSYFLVKIVEKCTLL
jgi:hypothetical protein